MALVRHTRQLCSLQVARRVALRIAFLHQPSSAHNALPCLESCHWKAKDVVLLPHLGAEVVAVIQESCMEAKCP